ncbi:hypothetical protein MVEN_01599500 [Mycena venus]|uniref:Uncharacterized protein n=1 Tax=Mycena venus TaxID=2733690 RepID=A0A8H6XQT0_9AGAR|nr:hypothetical protein MVEN_01599500 [Mycena venus]
MPHQPVRWENRVSNLLSGLQLVNTLLNELHGTFGSSSLLSITRVTQLLITGLQNAKRNKIECTQLMEEIHQVLYTIATLHIQSDTPGSVPPAILDHIGKSTETMHKINTFIEAQSDGNRIRRLFRQNELTALLKDCRTGLQDAKEVFKARPFKKLHSDKSDLSHDKSIPEFKVLFNATLHAKNIPRP